MSKHLYVVFEDKKRDVPVLLPAHVAIFQGDPEFDYLIKSFLWEQGVRLGKYAIEEK